MRSMLFALVAMMTLASGAHAALVWESTFDTDADGVVGNIVNGNETCGPGGPPCSLPSPPFPALEGFGNGSVMIGANSGGVQDIVANSIIDSILGNKAGRPTSDNGGPASLKKDTSWSALYTFNWTLGGPLVPNVDAISMVAGAIEPICCNSQTHVTRRHMGARIERQVDAGGNEIVQVFGTWASEGFTGVGRDLPAPTVNLNEALGGDPNGKPLQLAMGYNDTTQVLTVSLHDGVTGAVLQDNSGDMTMTSNDITTFDNLGPNPLNIQMELDNLNNTQIGFSEFTQVTNDIDTTWHMDSLRFYDDPQGAFDDVVGGPTLLLGDADNSGTVTADDLISVQQNFGNVGPIGDGTDLGDANDDGTVTADDLISVQQNFGNTLGAAGAAVPEPSALVLLCLGGLAAVGGRR